MVNEIDTSDQAPKSVVPVIIRLRSRTRETIPRHLVSVIHISEHRPGSVRCPISRCNL